jgi:phage baseplate assembly protein V
MKTTAALGELTVEVAGAALRPGDADCLAGLRVRQALSLPAQCELTFTGTDDDFSERAALFLGLSLVVRGGKGDLFEGEVTAVEHAYAPDAGRAVRLRAYDALHRLRKRQPVEVRNDVDAGELCRQFAGDIGLSAEVAEAGPRWPRLAQWSETDFDLLAETARRAGLFFAVWDGSLQLFTLAGVGDAIALRLGDDLLEASVEVNGDRAWSEVSATGWDPGTGARFDASAGSARSGRTADAAVTTRDVGGEPKRTLVNAPVPAGAHVEAEAQGELDQATANAVTVRGVAQGNPALHPGCKVELAGVHARVAGTYVVAEVIHTVDPERGYLSEFSSEVPVRRRPAAAALVAPGVVDRVDDPDSQGRVTVKLPGFQDIETGWMRVMLPGAGATKGFVALPDEGDEVLVLLPHGDPSAGIVLGGLFGVEDVPDTGIVDRRVQRQSWRSRHGHYLEIDDEQKRITVKHANGSMVRLGDDRVSIKTVTDLEIDAAGHTITITAAAVDFRKG